MVNVIKLNITYQIQPVCLLSCLLKVEHKTVLVRLPFGNPLALTRDNSNKLVSAHFNKLLSVYLWIHHVQ